MSKCLLDAYAISLGLQCTGSQPTTSIAFTTIVKTTVFSVDVIISYATIAPHREKSYDLGSGCFSS